MGEQRNGIGCKSSGDKQYKYPEYSHRFFHEGNLTVGSGFTRGSYDKTIARNSTAWEAFGAEHPNAVQRKTYRQLQAEAQQKQAEDSVVDLLSWEREELKAEPGANYEEPSDTDSEGG